MPVSKKRKKKGSKKPIGPPVSKSELTAGKKKKLTKQQIFIFVFSALIIISLAASFLVGSGSSVGPHDGGQVDASGVVEDGNNVFAPENQDAAPEDEMAPHDNTSETE